MKKRFFANGIMRGTSTTPPLFTPMGPFTREMSIATFNQMDPAALLG
jgi:hypothetical protein